MILFLVLARNEKWEREKASEKIAIIVEKKRIKEEEAATAAAVHKIIFRLFLNSLI